jgi:hypothetical protein
MARRLNYTPMEGGSTRTATRCYLSTPEHSSTAYGRYVYIYTDKGSLEATAGHLRFTGRRTDVALEIASITELRLGRFGRLAKPAGLARIEVTWANPDAGGTRTVYFVPTQSAFMPTWKTNDIVTDWYDWLSRQQQDA